MDAEGNVVGEGDARPRRRRCSRTSRQSRGGRREFDDVVKVTVFITDMAHYDEIHEVRRRYFGEPYPASSMVEVSALIDPRLLVEVGRAPSPCTILVGESEAGGRDSRNIRGFFVPLDYTYRIHLPHRTGQLARVAGAIAEGGGLIGDVTTVNVGRDSSIREITLEVADRGG